MTDTQLLDWIEHNCIDISNDEGEPEVGCPASYIVGQYDRILGRAERLRDALTQAYTELSTNTPPFDG